MKLRKHRRLSYSHPHRFEDEFTNVMHHALTQYTLKAGMRHYKERGEKGVTAEMKQIQEKLTFKPVNKSSLTTDQRANDLHALMFPKEMRTGKIKGRMCADGRKQQKKSDKKSATSPTSATESVLISTAIDATARRDVALVDAQGDFLTSDMDK